MIALKRYQSQVGKKTIHSMENSTNPENECITYSEKSEKNYDALNTLQLISGKWKILIMKSIAKSCPKRFGELRKDMDSMSQGTLTTQLRELEENGLICRKIYAEVPPKVEYKLSNLGITLLPIISELENWWQDYSLCIKNK
ncbi:helix-turn-helix transcriptional regulator [Elizabethkingia anophelis]|nr:helix-turn-helix transcriptional regulator [Elizabethkingia anophelis]MCT3651379.1 helix-turn-helix transcriptional regulator [Elizabethkingia anophelis]MCT3655377.1 helix-turn-helix transcriptional regulator [Elizabethkingia anophelis]MCT3657475.1 helix-turn-helix transcriptional regulator [Elizabethkingia anophelis]MCT3664607.1 helix-turn-helix transcriptional regulator [Elizabethkingia anophelis]